MLYLVNDIHEKRIAERGQKKTTMALHQLLPQVVTNVYLSLKIHEIDPLKLRLRTMWYLP